VDLIRAKTPEGLFESVENASVTVKEMRLLAARGVYWGHTNAATARTFQRSALARGTNTPDFQKSRLNRIRLPYFPPATEGGAMQWYSEQRAARTMIFTRLPWV
jgi:hypothetical protein